MYPGPGSVEPPAEPCPPDRVAVKKGALVPAPLSATPYVRRYANPVLIHLAGLGWFADLEHVGRRTGTVRHTPLLAFRDGDLVTIALTYGPRVQWLQNIRAARRCRLHLHGRLLELGEPRDLAQAEGIGRMPQPIRTVLARTGFVEDFVELPVLDDQPFPGTSWLCRRLT
jgi:deazaflavin-dependent oxidoreductase (nitroreductase family)